MFFVGFLFGLSCAAVLVWLNQDTNKRAVRDEQLDALKTFIAIEKEVECLLDETLEWNDKLVYQRAVDLQTYVQTIRKHWNNKMFEGDENARV